MKQLLLLFSLLTVFSASAQQIMWERQWIGQGVNTVFAVVEKNIDSSLIVAGSIKKTGSVKEVML